MKILLLRPKSKLYALSSVPPLGLGYLARALLNRGFDVEIADFNNRRCRENRLLEKWRKSPPDIIGLQLQSRDIAEGRVLIQRLRKWLGSSIPIVLGGPHPSTMPEQVLEDFSGADFAMLGEAEETLPKLVDYLGGTNHATPEAVPGLVYKSNGALKINPTSPPVDIDQLDFPAWDLMTLDGYSQTEVFGGGFNRRAPAMTLLTSRGCPWQCTFCCAKELYGRSLRLRNPERIVDEMDILHRQYGFREIKIIDDNFNAVRRHVLEVGRVFQQRPVDISTSFACGLQIHNLDDEVLSVFKLLGASELMVAVESGSQRVLSLMKKNIDLSQVPRKVDLIRHHGFKVILLFIIGYPGETREEIEQSVRMALELPIDRVHFNCFSPLPGTEIYRELKSQNRLADFNTRNTHFDAIRYSFIPGLTARQLNRLRQKALLRFYWRPKILLTLWASFHSWSGFKFLIYKALVYFKGQGRD